MIKIQNDLYNSQAGLKALGFMSTERKGKQRKRKEGKGSFPEIFKDGLSSKIFFKPGFLRYYQHAEMISILKDYKVVYDALIQKHLGVKLRLPNFQGYKDQIQYSYSSKLQDFLQIS